jgi:hypothetical protein
MTLNSVSPTPVQRLIDLGFKLVGEWRLNNTQPDPTIAFEPLEQYGDGPNVLYAFVAGDEILYIGKSVKTLNKRLAGYQRPGKSQFTNIRSNRRILDRLLQQKAVEIYALVDTGLLSYGGFHLNLAAGLEDSLIDALQPPWNLTGRTKD